MPRRKRVAASDDDDEKNNSNGAESDASSDSGLKRSTPARDNRSGRATRAAASTPARPLRKRRRATDADSDSDDDSDHDAADGPSSSQHAGKGKGKGKSNGDGTANGHADEGADSDDNGDDDSAALAELGCLPHVERSVDADGFVRGSVKKVTVTDFMVYTHAEFDMHPKLNMIIGPNGTGKSTIVCALAVGLSNKPNMIERGSTIYDYVRKDAESKRAIVEVVLSTGAGNPADLVVRRIIDAGTKLSKFEINRKPIKSTSVDTFLRKYHVQVDNICQFLPQERVSALAAMSPVDLLKEVQIAAGSSNMLTQHGELIDLDKQVDAQEKNVNLLRNELEQLVGQNQAIEGRYRRIQSREHARKQAALTWYMLQLSQYTQLQLEVNKKRGEKRTLATRQKALQADLTPMDTEIADMTSKVEELTGSINNAGSLMRVALQRLKAARTDMERSRATTMERKQDIDDVQRDIKRAEDRIALDQTKITELEAQVAAHTGTRQIEDRLRHLDGQLEHIKQQHLRIRSDHQLAQANLMSSQDLERDLREDLENEQRRLDHLRDRPNPRIAHLQKDDMPAYNVYHWIQANKDQFLAPVRGPLFLETEVPDASYARLVESQLPKEMLTRTYLIQNKHDYNLLASKFVDVTPSREFARISILEHVYDEQQQPINVRLPEQIQRLGFDSILAQFVRADDYILSFLLSRTSLSMPFASRKVSVDPRLMESMRYPSYVVRDTVYAIKGKSGEYVTTTQTISQGHGLLAMDNGASVERERQSAGAKIDELNSRLEEVQDKRIALAKREQDAREQFEEARHERMPLVDQQRELSASLAQYNKAKRDLDTAQHQLRRKMDALPPLNHKLANLESSMVHALNEGKRHALATKDTMTKLPKYLGLKRIGTIQLAVHHDLILRKFQAQTEIRGQLDEVSAELHAVTAFLQQTATRGHALKVEAAEALEEVARRFKLSANNANAEALELAKAQEDVYELGSLSLSDRIKSLEEKHMELSAQLDQERESDKDLRTEYEAREQTIEEKQGLLEEHEVTLVELLKTRTEVSEKWLAQLTLLLGEVSANFSDYFVRIRCAGEVALRKAASFKDYALEIRVKFRASQELQVLEKQRQSGGERAVSTILFLLSLQEHSRAPFRLVDEINQGMDELNERMIHKLLVDSAKKPHSPQYFLITPKLLCGLHYSDAMRIHCIFNGPLVDPAIAQDEHFSMAQFIRARRQQQQAVASRASAAIAAA
ncbi:P-loop containing nucleoside triphosphate hydrolase protein [Blastocladiella britannica]|nr:P-loop containing nucleoside triphosphate hydrolase protein [Blastocladiella britannica]